MQMFLKEDDSITKRNKQISKKKQDDLFPDWYWKYGLHDAEILLISKLEQEPDWLFRQQLQSHGWRNCMEFCLDCEGALYEQDISKIRLYQYQIRKFEFHPGKHSKAWWMGDKLTRLSNRNYLLEIEIDTGEKPYKQIAVEFESAETERI